MDASLITNNDQCLECREYVLTYWWTENIDYEQVGANVCVGCMEKAIKLLKAREGR